MLSSYLCLPLVSCLGCLLLQYPHEREVLFNPLTGLEVQETRVEGAVLVVATKPSVNLTSMTLEQVMARRKKVLANTLEGRQFELRQQMASEGVASADCVECLVEQFRVVCAAGPLGHDAAWYNSDEQMQKALRELLALGRSMEAGGTARFEILASMPPQRRERFGFPKVAFTKAAITARRQLDSPEGDTRREAAERLASLGARALTGVHVGAIANLLNDSEVAVRKVAMDALSGLEASALAPFSSSLGALLAKLQTSLAADDSMRVGEEDWKLGDAAIKLLAPLDAQSLEPLANVLIACGLRDDREREGGGWMCVDETVHEAVEAALTKLPPKVLEKHVDALVANCGYEPRTPTRDMAAMAVMARLDANVLEQHAAPLIDMFERGCDEFAHGLKLIPKALFKLDWAQAHSEAMLAKLEHGTIMERIGAMWILCNSKAVHAAHLADALRARLMDVNYWVRRHTLLSLRHVERGELGKFAPDLIAMLEDPIAGIDFTDQDSDADEDSDADSDQTTHEKESEIVREWILVLLFLMDRESLEPHSDAISQWAEDAFHEPSTSPLMRKLAEATTPWSVIWDPGQGHEELGPEVVKALLAKRDAAAIAQYAAAIIEHALKHMDDTSLGERAVKLKSTLEQLEARELERHAAALFTLLEHESADVSDAALHVLARLDPGVIDLHHSRLLSRVEDASSGVRQLVMGILGKLEAATLELYVSTLMSRLEDEDAGVRRHAIDALGKLEKGVLVRHAAVFIEKLKNAEEHVADGAVVVLSKLKAEALAAHAATLVDPMPAAFITFQMGPLEPSERP